MTKGFKKKQSKRVSCRKRYKIEKKVRDHNKKLRKLSKKKKHHSKAKDPGIPNSLPFKDKILQEIEKQKEHEQERKLLLRAELKKRRKDIRDVGVNKRRGIVSNTDLKTIAKNAEKKRVMFEQKSEEENAAKATASSSTSKEPNDGVVLRKDMQKVMSNLNCLKML